MTTLAIELRMVSAQTVNVTDEALIVDLATDAQFPCRWRGFRAFCMERQKSAATGG